MYLDILEAFTMIKMGTHLFVLLEGVRERERERKSCKTEKVGLLDS